MLLLACLAIPLAGCVTSGSVPPKLSIPDIPADIRTCFVGVVDVPDKALTVAEVEHYWKQDRVRSAAEARCGKRLIVWVDGLRKKWR